MFGSPVNAQKQADIVNAITGGEGRVQQACHQNDFVCRSFGSNPATLATLTYPRPIVIPAQAGIHAAHAQNLDSRLRGNDR